MVYIVRRLGRDPTMSLFRRFYKLRSRNRKDRSLTTREDTIVQLSVTYQKIMKPLKQQQNKILNFTYLLPHYLRYFYER